jgi:hypothetical protein
MKAFVLPALSVAVAVALGAAAATSSAHGRPAGEPDSYVANWDAIGTQAYAAAGLTAAT